MRVGPWRVEAELGRGGMATVYAATHTRFGKRAALKLANRGALTEEFTSDTFLREARIVHLIDHPGVPDVFATGTYDGRPYMAMERLTGQTLGQLVDAHALDRATGLAVLGQLCEVLAATHAAGVVHRDLKLDNVIVLGSCRVKLVDWGVARVLAEPDPLTGMIAGTLTYMAPEQVEGEISPALDVYSLGVLAYHVLLGGPPFTAASDFSLIKQHLQALPPDPATRWPEIPAELAAVLTAMLSKQPANRPSLDAIATTFEAARRALEPRPRRFELLARLARGVRQRVVMLATAAGLATAAIVTS